MSAKMDLRHLPGNRRRAKWQLVWLPLPVLLYAGYVAGLVWEYYRSDRALWMQVVDMALHPLPVSMSQEVMLGILAGLLGWIIMTMSYVSSISNRMPGAEYGKSRFARPEEINRKFESKEGDNRILGAHLRMSLNDKATGLNNNLLIIGGSGSGKSFYTVRPNILAMAKSYRESKNAVQTPSSLLITDPKGELYRDTAPILRRSGYVVKCLNLIDCKTSTHYNPMQYIRSVDDVVKVVETIIRNTTPDDSHESDPFWTKAESLYLQSLFLMVYLSPEFSEKRNICTVLDLMQEAKIPENDKEKSELDLRMDKLARKEWSYPGEAELLPGKEHPAYKSYMSIRRGAVDTVRSVIVSANARMAAWVNNNSLLRILQDDEMELASIGMGYDGRKQPTAVFCITPVVGNGGLNAIAGIFYSQLLSELYYQAMHCESGRLPIRVQMWLDEFCNIRIASAKDFCQYLATMRGYNISCVIIIQNISQIKAQFKDIWQTVPGNSDCLLYLGGNEQESHKYIVDAIGKFTLQKRSFSESKGRNGSASQSDDVIGRELMTADEIRMLDNSQCIVLIRGEHPVIDGKYLTHKSVEFKEAERIRKEEENSSGIIKIDVPTFGPLGADEEEHFRKQGPPAVQFTLEEFLELDDDLLDPEDDDEIDMSEVLKKLQKSIAFEKMAEEDNARELRRVETAGATLKERVLTGEYTEEQVAEGVAGFEHGLSEEAILSYFRPELSVTRMKLIREQQEKKMEQQKGHAYGITKRKNV